MTFRLNPFHPLYQGLVFGGFGAAPGGLTYYDSSVYGNHGTLTNFATPGTSWGWSSELGRGMLTGDGTAGYVNIGRPALGSGDFTLAAWYKTSNNDVHLFDTGAAGSTAKYTWFVADSLIKTFRVDDGITVVNLTNFTLPQDGVWHHAVARRRSGYLRVYVDGVQSGSTANATAVGDVTSESYDTWLLGTDFGRNQGADEVYSTGSYADHAIWLRALSEAEISILANRSDPSLGGLKIFSDTSGKKKAFLPIALSITDRYWVNESGDGNWNNGMNWATTSGGAGGAGVPTNVDNVYFTDGSVDNCTCSTNISVASITVESTYNGAIDINGKNIVLGGALVFNGGIGANGPKFADGVGSSDMQNGKITIGAPSTISGYDGFQLEINNLDFDLNGSTLTATYCTITNSDCTNGTGDATSATNVDGTSNTFWDFGGVSINIVAIMRRRRKSIYRR